MAFRYRRRTAWSTELEPQRRHERHRRHHQRARQRARHDAAPGKPRRSRMAGPTAAACSRGCGSFQAWLRVTGRSSPIWRSRDKAEFERHRRRDRQRARHHPELIAEHGLKPDEYERIVKLIGRDAELHRARHLLGDVERALLLQVLAAPPAHAADQGAPGDPGPGRERRRRRHRRRRTPCVFKMESHNHP